MNAWDLLAIAPTVDARKIKLAYAALLKRHHPDEDPEGFQRLRTAYEACLEEARRLKQSSRKNVARPQGKADTDAAPHLSPSGRQDRMAEYADGEMPLEDSDQLVQAVMEEIAGLYQDFHKRLDIASWQRILDRDILQRIDVKSSLNLHLFAFMAEHPNLPGEVCALLDQRFNWSDQPIELTNIFHEKVLDLVYWRLHFATFKHDYLGLKHATDIDFDNYIALREEAAHLLARNEMNKAGSVMEQAKAIYAEDPVLHFLMGQLAERRLDDEGAIDHYTRMFALAPQRLEGYLYRAHAFLRQNKIMQAFDDFQSVLEQDADNLIATKGLAQCHQHLENFEEAKLLYELSLEKQPSDFEIIVAIELLNDKLITHYEASGIMDIKRVKALVLCYLNAHQPGKAITLLEQCSNKDSDTYLLTGKAMTQQNAPCREVDALYQKGLQAAGEADENGYELLMARGKLLADNEFHADAAMAYKAAWEINPQDAAIAQQIAWALFYADDGRDDEALAWIERAIAMAPERYAFQQTKGHILYFDCQWQAALQPLDIYIETFYNAPFEHYAKGICHYSLGQFDEAAQSLRIAQQMGRKEADLPLFLAISNYKTGLFKEAYSQIERYETECWDKYYLKGKIEIQLGHSDKALASFKAGGDKFGSWDCFAGMACSYIHLADYDNAIAMLKGLNRDIPDRPWVLFNLAAVYCLNKQWDACLGTAEYYIGQCATDDVPIDSDIYYYRAMALYRLNKLSPAVEEAEKACSKVGPQLHLNLFLSMLHYKSGQISKAIRHLAELEHQEEGLNIQVLMSALQKSMAPNANAQKSVSFEAHFPEIQKIIPPSADIDAISNDLN
ncbi:MAG: tetratricopeptide repeat protein [Desulfobacteraceae bacterium]|jgi:tetratricopeptide (TPR) repeat protein